MWRNNMVTLHNANAPPAVGNPVILMILMEEQYD